MSLTTTSEIIQAGNLPANLDTDKLAKHLINAERRLRELLGDTLYETIEAESGTDRKTHCSLAEAYMTLNYAVPILGLNINNLGGIIQSTGFEANRQELLDFNQLRSIAARYEEMAMDLLAAYLPEPDTDTDTQADDILDVGGGFSFIAIGDPTENVLET